MMNFEVSRYSIDKNGRKSNYYKKGYIDEHDQLHITEERGTLPTKKALTDDDKFLAEYERKIEKENGKKVLGERITSVKNKLRAKMEKEVSKDLALNYRAIINIQDEFNMNGSLSKEAMNILNDIAKIV